jgi:hypothetical protein
VALESAEEGEQVGLEDGGGGHHVLRDIRFKRTLFTAPFAVC